MEESSQDSARPKHLWIRIRSWAKYNTRPDVKSSTWFRLAHDIFDNPDTEHLSDAEVGTIVYLLSQASKVSRDTYRLTLSAAAFKLKTSESEVMRRIELFAAEPLRFLDFQEDPFNAKQDPNNHVTSTLRPRNESVTDAERTRNGDVSTNERTNYDDDVVGDAPRDKTETETQPVESLKKNLRVVSDAQRFEARFKPETAWIFTFLDENGIVSPEVERRAVEIAAAFRNDSERFLGWARGIADSKQYRGLKNDRERHRYLIAALLQEAGLREVR